jgi:hypothetical protein
MLGTIKGFFLKKGAKVGFDSAFASVRKLSLDTQHHIAADVRKEFVKLIEILNRRPEELEGAIKSLLQQSTFTRQLLVKSGASTSCDDPSWLHQALLESSAMAMLTGDENLVAHVFNSIAAWTGQQFQFESSSPIRRSLDLPVSTQIQEQPFPMSGGAKSVGNGRVEVVPDKARTTKKPRKTSVAKKKAIKKPTKSKSASVKKSALSRKKSSKKAVTPRKKAVKK